VHRAIPDFWSAEISGTWNVRPASAHRTAIVGSYRNDKVWHDRFVDRLGKGATVLDLSCGPSRPVAQHMVERGLHVTGVDSSPTMISLCRERLPDQKWIVADTRQLVLGRCDGILAWDSFFHLAHGNNDECLRSSPIRPPIGSVLMFNTEPQYGEAMGQYRGDPLYHASFSRAEYEALVARLGLHMLQHVPNDAQAGGRTVWLCQRNE
jgi:hypothetical protein